MTVTTGGGGRPRDENATRRVLEATLALLAERGLSDVRVDDVVSRAGVAKTTVYRRWPSRAHLILDAVEFAVGPREVKETGNVVADLLALVRALHHSLVGNPIGRALPHVGIAALQDPELADRYRQRIIDPLRGQAIRLVRQGCQEGRFPLVADPALVVDALVGAVIHRIAVLGEDISLEDLETLAGMLLSQDFDASGDRRV